MCFCIIVGESDHPGKGSFRCNDETSNVPGAEPAKLHTAASSDVRYFLQTHSLILPYAKVSISLKSRSGSAHTRNI